MSRLEQTMHVEGDLSEERYVKFSLKPEAIERLLVDLFIEQKGNALKQIILDMDVTDDPVHGTQEQSFFSLIFRVRG